MQLVRDGTRHGSLRMTDRAQNRFRRDPQRSQVITIECVVVKQHLDIQAKQIRLKS